MNITINNGIAVSLTLIAKKNKTDKSKYCIYVAFYIYQKGIKQDYHSISTGVTVSTTDWKNGEVTGIKYKANLKNDNLNDYLQKAKDLLNTLILKKVKTCSELKNEIKLNAKQIIIGKAPRGLKNNFISKLKDYTYSEILNRYLAEKHLSKARKRNYLFTVNLVNQYFENHTPTLDLITVEDLEGIKKFVSTKYKNQNTATTFLEQIAAVIKYAVKLKVIAVSPIPENFRGSFKNGERKILSEKDCLKIMALDDSSLTHTELVAKYSLSVQMLTGIGYGDLKTIKFENIKYDESADQHIIEKERNKTGVRFIVNLTANALFHVTKLRELTGNNENPFNLPSIEYISRMYKIIALKAKVTTGITTYTLRHTFSVNYMENGGRLEDLQVRLGHTNIKTTQIYGKISAKRNAETTKDLEVKSKIHQLQQTNLKAV